MKKSIFTDIQVFLASPTDTNRERQQIENYIKSTWNPSIGEKLGVRLIIKMWENDLPATSGKTPQQILDEILKSSDLLIGMFWKKFGFKVFKGTSATGHEIETFLAMKKHAILYFSTKRFTASDVDPNELANINEFKQKYKSGNVYHEFSPTNATIKERLEKDLEYNIKQILYTNDNTNSDKQIVEIEQTQEETTIDQRWAKISITKEINAYMHEHGYKNLNYNRRLTFDENVKIWKIIESQHDKLERIAQDAREYAFEKKYGNYDYLEDLRSVFKSNWFMPIHMIIKQLLEKVENLNIIAVAANRGEEIEEIFNDSLTQHYIEAIDICEKAILHGKKKYGNKISFYQGRMENIDIPDSKNKYDVYLNLRSIHSNGVDRKEAILQSLKVLKTGGVAIYSISDGYLENMNKKKNIIKGMYDTYHGIVNTHVPYSYAIDIRQIMEEYGFENAGLYSHNSEIFVYGKKKI